MTSSTSNEGKRTIIGFDFGKKFIGLALGQELTGSARPLGAVKAKDGIPQWPDIAKFVNEWQPDFLLWGYRLIWTEVNNS